MTKYSIKDLDLRGKRVFIRVDFNVPIKNGAITDDTRITSSLPTIHYALDQGATVILASHLGRPKGKPTPEFSLKPVADRLQQLLKRDGRVRVRLHRRAGETAVAAAHERIEGRPAREPALPRGRRKERSRVCEGAGRARRRLRQRCLRRGASRARVGRGHGRAFFKPPSFAKPQAPSAAAGLLMEKELRYLGMALGDPERPFVAVIGGAKVSDKIEVIESMLGRVDRLLIGGAMAYTFFKALGMPVGKSLVEEDKQDAARSVIDHAKARGVVLQLPVDHVVADKIDAAAKTEVLKVGDAAIGDRMGLDIGPESARLYAGLLADAKTVVWNGPMGVFEVAPFAKGTLAVANAVAAVKGTTIIGGGDSVAAINAAGVADKMTHISTGGGASLEFLGGAELPGVAALPG